MSDEIRTARLVLRRARPEDAVAMHDVLSDPEVMRYWATPPHVSVEQTHDWISAMIDADEKESDDFLVTLDGRVIGKAGCWRLPEIGFALHRRFWGQGLAREAIGGVVDHVFARHRISAITADVDPRNLASLAALKQAGFIESGRAAKTWFVNDEWCDSVYLALSRQISGPMPLR